MRAARTVLDSEVSSGREGFPGSLIMYCLGFKLKTVCSKAYHECHTFSEPLKGIHEDHGVGIILS